MAERGRILRERICKLCGHRWFPRTLDRPRICPHCKSARWDVGRKYPKPEPPSSEARALVLA